MTLLLFTPFGVSSGQTQADAIRQLAAGWAGAIPSHSAVSITLENRSALDSTSTAEFLRMVQQALADGGYSMSESGAPLKLSISENIHGLLAIAQLGPKIVMAQWRPAGASSSASRARIEATSVWSQSEPILDILRSDAAMLVLEPARVVLYRRAGESWKLNRFALLSLGASMSRDPRGRLTGTTDSFRVTAPGASCAGSVRADLSLTCGDSFENPWIAGRNLQHDQARGDFYSSADLANGAVAIAGVDRKVRIFAGPHLGASIALEGLGSDVAAIRDSCGVEWLATQGSSSGPDAVTGMNASGAPATEPAAVSGPVTALWPAEQPGDVTAVVYNSSVRIYEAFRLAIHCAE